MKKLLLTTVLAFIGSVVFAQERIAVFPFEDMDKVFSGNEAVMFYREFSNEFTNKSAGKFSVVPRQEVDKLINTEAAFQLNDFSARAKTAEMQRVLNGTQILSGLIGKLGNNLRITVSLYTYPELQQLPGGTTLSVANKDELFNKIPELVRNMQNEISGGDTNSGGRTAVNSAAAPPQNPVPNNMVRINGGTFTMGSLANEAGRYDDEGPQHQVTVSSFYMGKYEVTQKEYQEVMGTNPSEFKGDNLPVEQVSWYDAVEYCNARSRKEGLRPAYTIDKSRKDPNNNNDYDVKWVVTWNRSANGYRLPTEAEWEYACRAGTTTAYNTGASISNNTGWYRENSGYTTHPVGQKPANAWGLYDMHGNVYEWCWDWFGNYSSGAQADPVGASSGSFRVLRGGGWYNSAQDFRSAFRVQYSPTDRYDTLGFRVLRP